MEDPELLLALTLANLMSPALWDFHDALAKIQPAPPIEPIEKAGPAQEDAVMTAIADIDSPDQAIALIQQIGEQDSIFGDRERLSLPDEVLLFRTGSDRDKALLLYSLGQLGCFLSPAEKADSAIILGEENSFVQLGSHLFDAGTLATTTVRPEGKRLHRQASPGPQIQ